MAPPSGDDIRGFAQTMPNGRLRCMACQRGCELGAGELGFCRVRRNVDGRLAPLSYGRVAALHLAEVERKPLFHFYPGEVMLSVGGLGCNFRCPGCQNWDLAHADVPDALSELEYVPPRKLVEEAQRRDLLGVSWTYNEPAIWFEYTLDGARLARAEGLLTNYVTNGSLTREALDEIGPFLNAYRVDVKGCSAGTYGRAANFPAFQGILEVAERAKVKWGMHVECVTNVIPTINDSEAELKGIANWIAAALGPDTPWHVTRFVPHGRLSHLPRTPVPTLERARETGLEAGLRFVYIGNVFGHPAENTCCPDCGRLLIERSALGPPKVDLDGSACPACGCVLPGRFR